MATFNFTLNNAETYTAEALSAATLDAAKAFVAKQNDDLDVVANAVNAVFDENKGAALNFDFIRTQVVGIKLNTPPSAFKEISERVHSYLKANTAVKETGMTASGNQPLFVSERGRNGGTKRISDIAVPTV